jgi:hypothetical protein
MGLSLGYAVCVGSESTVRAMGEIFGMAVSWLAYGEYSICP